MTKPARREPVFDEEQPQEADTPLFRKEALESKQNEWLGSVLLQPNRNQAIFSKIAIAAICALVLLLIFGSYTRKVKVSGWLVPSQGLARVYAPQPGIVTKVLVSEGKLVHAGEPLVAISGDTQSEALVGAREEAVRQLRLRRDRMDSTMESQRRMLDEQRAEQENRVATLESEAKFLAKEFDLQLRRARLAQDALKRETAMRERGLIPLPRLQRAQQEMLDQAARLQSMERNKATLSRDVAQAKAQLGQLPLKANLQFDEIDRSRATIEQELAEAETRRRVVLTAPEDGVVTAIHAELGSSVSTSTAILTIVPDHSQLEAQLYTPSRGVGFLRPGQRVYMRFQSYAYQKFGLQEGVVKAVSRTASSAAELPPQLSAIAALASPNEPVYRITVTLSSQNVRAYGQQVPLKAGMLVDADVLVESRRLIEWMFEPLISISGSFRS